MASDNNPEYGFKPNPEHLEFILDASKALAEKYERHPCEFSINLGISPDGSKLSGDNYIGYIGLRPSPDLKVSDTVKIGRNMHSVDNYGESPEIRVPIPKSF